MPEGWESEDCAERDRQQGGRCLRELSAEVPAEIGNLTPASVPYTVACFSLAIFKILGVIDREGW